MDKIGFYMSSPVLTTSPETLAHVAMVKMLEKKVGAFLVKENDEWVGIFTKADWTRKIVKREEVNNSEKVCAVMTKTLITIKKNESMAKAGLLMENHRIRHIPVTENGKIVGILSSKDLQRYYCQLHDQE